MKRYENSKILKKYGTKSKPEHKHKSTTLYSKIPHREEDLWVVTQYGDRLDLIANQFYGDKSLWWYIAKANHMNFMNIEPGKIIRIPAHQPHTPS